MLFPDRILRSQIPHLFAQLTAANPDVIILGYAEHHDKVPQEEEAKLRNVAARIVNSFDTNTPIVAVQIVGHADRDLRVSGKAREHSEQSHSLARASEVRELLLQFIKNLRPRGQRALNSVMFKHSGIGATQLKILKPNNEQERRLNRRVEIFLGQSLVRSDDPQPPQIIPPELPDPNFEDNDPNTVFAGDKFRIKMLSATAFGEVVGLETIEFLLWDIKNSRTAHYEYFVPILTGGTPITFTGEGNFSDTFTTSKFIQVDQFTGIAEHISAGAGPLGLMHLSISPNLFPRPVEVNVPTGNSKGFGIDLGKSGSFTLVKGSVEVFRGP